MPSSKPSNKPRKCRPLVDLWEDTPESFPFKEIYRHTFIYPRLFSALIGLSLLFLSAFSMLCGWLPRNGISVLVLGFFGGFSPFIISLLILSRYERLIITNDRRLQCFVNRNGTGALSPIIKLLLLTLKENTRNRLESRLITNLHKLLIQIDSVSAASLVPDERSFLCGLVDPEGYTDTPINPKQLLKLEEFGSMLSSPATHALGVLGGDDSIHALQNRLARSESPRMIELITHALHMASPVIGSFDLASSKLKGSSPISDSLMDEIGRLPGDKKHKPIKVRVAVYGVIIAYFTSIFTMMHFGNHQVQTNMLVTLLLTFPVLLIIGAPLRRRYMNRMHRVRLVLSNRDDPSTLRILTSALETVYEADPTFLLPTLVAAEAVQNITSQSIPKLNGFQLNQLYKLIMPSPVYAPEKYDMENPLPDIRPTGTLLKSLALLGDTSSVRFLERFVQQTSDQQLVKIANETLMQLKERLAVKPHQLLRASELPDDGLLQPAGSKSSGDLLQPAGAVSPAEEVEAVKPSGS